MNYVAEYHSEIAVEIGLLKMAQLCLFFNKKGYYFLEKKKCPSPTNANKGQLLKKGLALKIVNVKNINTCDYHTTKRDFFKRNFHYAKYFKLNDITIYVYCLSVHSVRSIF